MPKSNWLVVVVALLVGALLTAWLWGRPSTTKPTSQSAQSARDSVDQDLAYCRELWARAQKDEVAGRLYLRNCTAGTKP